MTTIPTTPGFPPPLAPQAPDGMQPQMLAQAPQSVVIDWATLSRQAGQGFEPLPAGDYDVVVTECQHTTSSTGKPMYKTKFKVESGPSAGRTAINNFVLTIDNPNALGFFFQHMAAMGLDQAYFASNPHPDQVAQALIGRRCRISLVTEFRAGAQRNNLTKVMPPTGPVAIAQSQPMAQVPQQQVPMQPVQPMQPQQQAPVYEQPQPAPIPQPVAAQPAPIAPPTPIAPQPVVTPESVPQPVDELTVLRAKLAELEAQANQQPAPQPVSQPQPAPQPQPPQAAPPALPF